MKSLKNKIEGAVCLGLAFVGSHLPVSKSSKSVIEFGDTYRNCWDILSQFNKANPNLSEKYVVYPLINPEISDDEFVPSIIMEKADATYMEQYRQRCLDTHRRLPLSSIIEEEVFFINNHFKQKYAAACQQAKAMPMEPSDRIVITF